MLLLLTKSLQAAHNYKWIIYCHICCKIHEFSTNIIAWHLSTHWPTALRKEIHCIVLFHFSRIWSKINGCNLLLWGLIQELIHRSFIVKMVLIVIRPWKCLKRGRGRKGKSNWWFDLKIRNILKVGTSKSVETVSQIIQW